MRQSSSHWFLFSRLACGTALAAGPADLIDAVQTGNTAAAIKLIDQKVNVNGTSADGTTALHWAVHNCRRRHGGPPDSRWRQCQREE